MNGVRKVLRMPPLAIAHKVARLVPFRPLDAGRLVFLRLNGVPRVPSAMLRGRTAVRLATVSDLDLLAALESKRSVFESRFASGDHCLVALADGRIAGYEWFSDRAVHREIEWAYDITIPPDVVYAYDAFIHPAYRNSGVWLQFKAQLADWMVAHAKRAVITFVDEGNVASLRAHLRFGFTPTTTVLAVRFFGARLFRATSGVTFNALGTPASGRPFSLPPI
jgi:GNAT superfamily N-acetyltransferase